MVWNLPNGRSFIGSRRAILSICSAGQSGRAGARGSVRAALGWVSEGARHWHSRSQATLSSSLALIIEISSMNKQSTSVERLRAPGLRIWMIWLSSRAAARSKVALVEKPADECAVRLPAAENACAAVPRGIRSEGTRCRAGAAVASTAAAAASAAAAAAAGGSGGEKRREGSLPHIERSSTCFMYNVPPLTQERLAGTGSQRGSSGSVSSQAQKETG
jgi:hypothetical protein